VGEYPEELRNPLLCFYEKIPIAESASKQNLAHIFHTLYAIPGRPKPLLNKAVPAPKGHEQSVFFQRNLIL